MKNYPPFNLTVNQEGVVSLWDTERDAKFGAPPEDEYVRFELTVEQVHVLEQAQFIAENRHRHGTWR